MRKRVLVPTPEERDTSEPQQYEVGYGRPPKHTRFAPGKSGNRKGRPRGSRNIKTLVSEFAKGLIKVKEGGRERTLTRADALIRKLFADAITGNTKATTFTLQFFRDAGLLSEEDEVSNRQITPEDQAIIRDYLKLQKSDQSAIENTSKTKRLALKLSRKNRRKE